MLHVRGHEPVSQEECDASCNWTFQDPWRGIVECKAVTPVCQAEGTPVWAIDAALLGQPSWCEDTAAGAPRHPNRRLARQPRGIKPG